MKSCITSYVDYLRALVRDERGLTIVEYAVAGAVVAGVIATAFGTLGTNIAGSLDALALKLK